MFMQKHRDPKRDPRPGDVVKLGKDWVRMVEKVNQQWVYFETVRDGESYPGLKLRRKVWLESLVSIGAEVLHVAE